MLVSFPPGPSSLGVLGVSRTFTTSSVPVDPGVFGSSKVLTHRNPSRQERLGPESLQDGSLSIYFRPFRETFGLALRVR